MKHWKRVQQQVLEALWPHTAKNNSNLNCQIWTVFLYDFLVTILGKMGYFIALDDKSIIKADSRLFLTLILVRFPYNHLGKNR